MVGDRGDGRRRWPYAVAGVAAAGILVFAFVYGVPVAHAFSFGIPSIATCAPATATESYPGGAKVTGTWATVGTLAAEVSIHAPDGSVVYGGSGTNGSFSFGSVGGTYTYSAISTVHPYVGCQVPPSVNVVGSWSATLWQSWHL